ncbi:LysM peptidoglycan-binding domain-containing protein [Lihuaxuella thermophila]|uniref:Stage VI sporulation protein D n=1 Tax=Lihuaxuella thermophila TaxID=1173111 RepID=A0A1H8D3Z5_9BACL|nr:LysM peptidoglycan-binding domain-containing protein [Lihuaxuella thermophila]SEN01247.1 stage VI sporulation protein D [Lihuaxuella thermophila]
MESQFNQLRFDISEKVRLHPQQPGIGTLLEMDLYPDVEIRDEGTHLKIQGYLRLNGVYLGKQPDDCPEDIHLHMDHHPDEGNRQEIAYVIPVEITLPADRAELSHISAEVETFDYSVVSPFELQIEAILMIDGLLPEKKGQEDADQIAEEQEAAPVFSGSPAEPVSVSSEDMREDKRAEEDGLEEMVSVPGEDSRFAQDSKEDEDHFARRDYLKIVEDDEPVNEKAEQHAEREEDDDPDFEPQSAEDFWAERQKSRREQAWREKDLEQEAEMDRNRENSANQEVKENEEENEEGRQREGHWSLWLINSKEENFLSMRMVIVQKDETIDQLAEKYNVSPAALMSVNKLQSGQLEEGQIIYIPNQKEEKEILTRGLRGGQID